MENYMSKIVEAVKVMVSNSNNISNVINLNSYWFFLYDEKYAWCIESWYYEGENRYMLYFLKAEGNFYVGDAREFERLSRKDVKSLIKEGNAIEYNSSEIGTDEVLQAFRLLFTAVKEKGVGIDKVLDEIINV
tara:strand:+ start:2486 stop:2884 length:399 start_codon:yes stop_codon:yes gene_type:complete